MSPKKSEPFLNLKRVLEDLKAAKLTDLKPGMVAIIFGSEDGLFTFAPGVAKFFRQFGDANITPDTYKNSEFQTPNPNTRPT